MAEQAVCWCGCGTPTGATWAPGHDSQAASMLAELLYGTSDIAARLAAHGFGPGRRNLTDVHRAATAAATGQIPGALTVEQHAAVRRQLDQTPGAE
jgi:hypothetical protein